VFHDAGGVYAGTDEPYLFGRPRVRGPDREHRSYRSSASFHDSDGNGWLMQEITTRLPGRIDPATTSFGSANDLASALRRAAAAHGQHEKRIGGAGPNWPDWYAEYGARAVRRRVAAINDCNVIVIGGGAPASPGDSKRFPDTNGWG
jgi:hypothetical protein